MIWVYIGYRARYDSSERVLSERAARRIGRSSDRGRGCDAAHQREGGGRSGFHTSSTSSARQAEGDLVIERDNAEGGACWVDPASGRFLAGSRLISSTT